MLRDFIAAFGFLRDLRKALRRLPEGVGFSIVTYGENDPTKDHLRIVNLTPLTIHGFRCTIQNGAHGQPCPINFVYLRSDADVYGDPVIYRLNIPERGIYLRPGAWVYLPLAEALPCKADDDLRLGFTYLTPQGRRVPGKLQHVVRVNALYRNDD